MPLVDISVIAGRDEERIAALITEVTEAVTRSLDVAPETVRVLVRELPASHWGVAGSPRSVTPPGG